MILPGFSTAIFSTGADGIAVHALNAGRACPVGRPNDVDDV